MLWYLNRLKAMSLGEILWRTKTVTRLPFDWISSNRYSPKQSINGFNGAHVHGFSTYPIHSHKLGKNFEKIKIFNLLFDVETIFNWHKDYFTGKVVERKFSRLLNIRESAKVGDIKYIWETNRHQYLAALCYSSDANRYKNLVINSLERWINENPYLKGVNWTSSLELALRIISWAFIFPFISADLKQSTTQYQRFLNSIYLHLYEIDRNLSRYSSANNHLIGEVAGLYIGAICFPYWKESLRWRMKAKNILEREILNQVFRDGVNKEQATGYQLFTLEFFILAYLIGKKCDDKFSEDYVSQLKAMLIYLDNTATATADLPWFGDSDDGRAFLISPFETNLQIVMELGQWIFPNYAFKKFAEKHSCAFHAIIGNGFKQNQVICKENISNSKISIFQDGGKAILRNYDDTVKMVMDFGELGYGDIAAHGHADALSIVLAINDEYLLIDPGTFAYHSFTEWRTYFRGTAAHNTIRIDHQDQAIIAGRFLWKSKVKTRLLNWKSNEKEDTITAEHYGYSRLQDPVIHRRSVTYDKTKNLFNIADTLVCNQEHFVEFFLHLDERAEIIDHDTSSIEIHFMQRRLVIRKLNNDFTMSILTGSYNPLAGWRSLAFHSKIPINTVRIYGTIYTTTTINTQILVV